MPRDESQILVLLMGGEQQQQQEQQYHFASSQPTPYDRDGNESIAEHGGFYSLPYSAQRPAMPLQESAPVYPFQTRLAATAERDPPVRSQISWDFQQPRAGAEDKDQQQHSSHLESLYSKNWNPLMNRMVPPVQSRPLRSAFDQHQSIPITKHHYFQNRQQGATTSSNFAAPMPTDSSFNDTPSQFSQQQQQQQIGFPARSQQFQFPSSQPESDSDSPECLSPFSSSASHFSSDFALDAAATAPTATTTKTATASSADEPESLRETASMLSSLDSYELMANLFSSRLAIGAASRNSTPQMSARPSSFGSNIISPLSPSGTNAPPVQDSALTNLTRALSPDMVAYNSVAAQPPQQITDRDRLGGRMMFRTFNTSSIVPPSSQWQPFSHSVSKFAPPPIPQSQQQPQIGFPSDSNDHASTVPAAAIGPNFSHTVDPDRLLQHQRSTEKAQAQQTNTPTYGYSLAYEVEFKRNMLRFVGGPGLEDLTVGEFVFVEADRGEHLGQVHQILLLNSPPIIQPMHHNCTCSGGGCTSSDCETSRHNRHHSNCTVAGRVLRRATMKDVQKITLKSKEETKAIVVANQKAKEYVLDMEVVDAEFQFDMKKLTFFYKARLRVDFRELVRDLYKLYRARIWMQKVDDVSLLI